MLNSTALQRQQERMTNTVEQLLTKVSQCNEISNMPKMERRTFRDCAEILRSGVKESGLYSIHLHNSTQDVK
ncbi:hypothetical protein CHARACLAT_016405, partial [Characodon lateralis]|nr:hypothetical protein [Characodon lateralis]